MPFTAGLKVPRLSASALPKLVRTHLPCLLASPAAKVSLAVPHGVAYFLQSPPCWRKSTVLLML